MLLCATPENQFSNCKNNHSLSFSGKAFCREHCEAVETIQDCKGNQRYETSLKGFLRSCSNEEIRVNPENYTKRNAGTG